MNIRMKIIPATINISIKTGDVDSLLNYFWEGYFESLYQCYWLSIIIIHGSKLPIPSEEWMDRSAYESLDAKGNINQWETKPFTYINALSLISRTILPRLLVLNVFYLNIPLTVRIFGFIPSLTSLYIFYTHVCMGGMVH